MTLKVVHQTGHNFRWNLQSLDEDKCGDGLIFSPVHQTPRQIDGLEQSVKKSSLFDPQFYLPSSQKPKFRDYDFFPETMSGGFATTTFETQAAIAAKKCVNYQTDQGFRKIVVPTRFISELYTDYIDRQNVFSVNGFLEAADGRPLCLNLALTPAMIADKAFRLKILNWVTSYPEIDELYLIFAQQRDSKQVVDSEYLQSCLIFSKEVQDAGLQLTIGYLNTESLLFSLLGDVTLSYGTFENTRIFSLDKFLVTDEERRGPRARIYLPGLFNWIQFDQAKECRSKALTTWHAIHRDSRHSEEAFKMAVDPAFNQPQLYRHHFICMQEQFEELRNLLVVDRKVLLLDWMHKAKASYASLAKAGIVLEKHGQGTHIDPWITAIKGSPF